jgi:hypothetical protein
VPENLTPTLPDRQSKAETPAPEESVSTRLELFNWSGIFFAVLQSACSAFIALSSFRLLIGVGALAAAATGALRFADRLHHSNALRISMMLLALVGSLFNLLALRRVWSLRRRPASSWRQPPVSRQKRRSEYLQFTISVLTLVVLAAELAAHYSLFHHF